MARYRNCCWTLNNPEESTVFDSEKMEYLVYQEEIGESGTYHFQGYVEFKSALVLSAVKALLGSNRVHVERRQGTQAQAIAYCKKEGPLKRIPGTDVVEEGTPRTQGKRVDLDCFRAEVMEGANLRDLLVDHTSIIARYPRFYGTLTSIRRPKRSSDLVVTLLYGETGLGKTRSVMERFQDDPDFYVTPLNNGTMWYDGYDGHKKVLLDDFGGKTSHIPLCSVLRLLDRYPVPVPTKGSHTWWLPDEVFITSNILPSLWYDKWEDRTEQYKALARRIHAVTIYQETGVDSLSPSGVKAWFQLNAPACVEYNHLYLNPMTGLPLVDEESAEEEQTVPTDLDIMCDMSVVSSQ